MSINRWMCEKYSVLLIHTKWSYGIYSEMGDHSQNESDSERQILHIFFHMWNLGF